MLVRLVLLESNSISNFTEYYEQIIGCAFPGVYVNVARSFLEVFNIATSHGVNEFPRQRSIKILLLR